MMDQERWDAKMAARQAKWEARAARRAERWERHQAGRGRGGTFLGVFIIAVGAIFLLQNMGLFYIGDVWEFWPLFLIAAGLSRLVAGCGRGRYVGGVMAFIGVGFLLRNLGFWHFNFWQFFWPAMMIYFGLMMLIGHDWRNDRWRRRFGGPDSGPGSPGGPSNGPSSGASTGPMAGSSAPNPDSSTSGGGGATGASGGNGDPRAHRLNDFAFFGGVERRVDSQEFEGGSVEAVFGGVELNMRGVGTKQDVVVVEATAIFGGVEIVTPEGWDVSVRGTGIFGGFEDKTIPRPNDGTKRPRLIVEGSAIFGGVSVM